MDRKFTLSISMVFFGILKVLMWNVMESVMTFETTSGVTITGKVKSELNAKVYSLEFLQTVLRKYKASLFVSTIKLLTWKQYYRENTLPRKEKGLSNYLEYHSRCKYSFVSSSHRNYYHLLQNCRFWPSRHSYHKRRHSQGVSIIFQLNMKELSLEVVINFSVFVLINYRGSLYSPSTSLW